MLKVTGDSLHQEIFASTKLLTKEAAMKLKQIPKYSWCDDKNYHNFEATTLP